MARQNDLDFDEETLLKEAAEWELTYGSLSGRCAAQFINHMKNKTPAKKEFNWS
jgi:predicted AAA+ superfamily ATPase